MDTLFFFPPLQPSCVRFTIRNPEGIAMVYASGKYVCMGGKSTVDMVTIARKVARKIQRIGNQRGAEVYKVSSRSAVTRMRTSPLPPSPPPHTHWILSF